MAEHMLNLTPSVEDRVVKLLAKVCNFSYINFNYYFFYKVVCNDNIIHNLQCISQTHIHFTINKG